MSWCDRHGVQLDAADFTKNGPLCPSCRTELLAAHPETCPRCGEHTHGLQTTSRSDNRTLVCGACGADEALLAHGSYEKPSHVLLPTWKQEPPDWIKRGRVLKVLIDRGGGRPHVWDPDQGAWFWTHQGVLTCEQSHLIDGRHVSAAVMRNGLPPFLPVFEGLPCRVPQRTPEDVPCAP